MLVDSKLTLRTEELSRQEWRDLFRRLTFFNDAGDEYAAYTVFLRSGKVELPRGAWNLLPDHVVYDDKRTMPPARPGRFKLTLDDPTREERNQQAALAAMLEQEQGFVVRPPGTGKTQIALAFACAVETPVLVLVHTDDILRQWVKYTRKATNLKVGVIQGELEDCERLSVATVQTLTRLSPGRLRAILRRFGAVLVDEGHHAAAESWYVILSQSTARYRLALTATEKRADGMEPLMKFLIGPTIHREAFASQVPLTVVPVKTHWKEPYYGPFDWSRLLRALSDSQPRNRLIADTAVRQVSKGHSTLILSRQIKHLENIQREINGRCRNEILTGRRSKKDRERILSDFRRGSLRCVLATQLADEALDVPRLSRVLLTFPGKHSGRIIQQIGRAIRSFPDKDNALIFDFVDDRISPLRRQWGERKQTYHALKIPIKKRRYDAEKKKNVSQGGSAGSGDRPQQRRSLRDLIPRRSRRGAGADRGNGTDTRRVERATRRGVRAQANGE
jgi:superfamily II DNA or RNA helicase